MCSLKLQSNICTCFSLLFSLAPVQSDCLKWGRKRKEEAGKGSRIRSIRGDVGEGGMGIERGDIYTECWGLLTFYELPLLPWPATAVSCLPVSGGGGGQGRIYPLSLSLAVRWAESEKPRRAFRRTEEEKTRPHDHLDSVLLYTPTLLHKQYCYLTLLYRQVCKEGGEGLEQGRKEGCLLA